MTALVGLQSRGMPVNIEVDEKNRSFIDAGRAMFTRRQGQLNIACAQCHEQRAGAKLAGNAIPQGHATGYPLYRLEWQGLGSLQRRLRNCMNGLRAEPHAYGAPEFVELELYLMWRARGCDSFQGFLFCKPQPADQIETLLRGHRLGTPAAPRRAKRGKTTKA